MDDLVAVADSALYEAKNNGRNTVRVRTTTVADDEDLAELTQPDTTSAAELEDVRSDQSD